MVEISPTTRRINGVYYTPDRLADKLCENIIQKPVQTVFDPAYGEGALLLAAERFVKQKFKDNHNIQLFGCDIHPINGLLQHIPSANLKEQNFLDYDINKKFDLILTNPPYVRHQSTDKEKILKTRKKHREFAILSKKSDLWTYFLLKSVLHMNIGGTIGAILPWSFLQADYAQSLRTYLAQNFSSIKLLAMNEPFFEFAAERIVMVWLEGYKSPLESIKQCFANDLNESIQFTDCDYQSWCNGAIGVTDRHVLDTMFEKLSNLHSFQKFSDHAKVRIGVVTGANKFFIKGVDEIESTSFISNSTLQPIITSVKEITNYLQSGKDILKRLVILGPKAENEHQSILEQGINEGIHLRSHSKRRRPWYAVNPGVIPDAFFTYRVKSTPFLILNEESLQSTNAIHRIYFKRHFSRFEKMWLVVSILSIYSQLSLSYNSKSYGRGMVKVEPSGLEKAYIHVSQNKSVETAYSSILEALSKNKKDEAVRVATSFINHELGISKDLQDEFQNQFDILSASLKR